MGVSITESIILSKLNKHIFLMLKDNYLMKFNNGNNAYFFSTLHNKDTPINSKPLANI